MSGRLVLVGTPLGNLDDVSLRMRSALAAADVVLCEDTRRSRRLLHALGIDTKLLPHHSYNEVRATERALQLLRTGQTVALISDAGMPLVSDPGFSLVRAAIAANIHVDAIPGPSAAVLALVLSGQPPLPHAVFGFLPVRGRTRVAKEIAAWPHTAILFVSPHRGAAEVAALAAACGSERPATLARELTKLHQELIHTTLGELAARLADDAPKGEWTLVLGPAVASTAMALDPEHLVGEVRRYAAKHRVGFKAAAQHIATAHNTAWRPLYRGVLAHTPKHDS